MSPGRYDSVYLAYNCVLYDLNSCQGSLAADSASGQWLSIFPTAPSDTALLCTGVRREHVHVKVYSLFATTYGLSIWEMISVSTLPSPRTIAYVFSQLTSGIAIKLVGDEPNPPRCRSFYCGVSVWCMPAR